MAIDNVFDLTHGGVRKTLAEWGLTLVSDNRANMQPDTVQLVQAGTAYDGAADFGFEDDVVIRKGGTLWFQGKVTSNSRSGQPQSESFSYTVSGVWDELEKATMMALWTKGTNPGNDELPLIIGDDYMSQVPLYVDPQGNRISVADTLSAVLAYASGVAGINVQLGSVSAAVTPWPSEVKDQTIAQVIRTIMKWNPSAVAQVDYSTTRPTINFIDRADATVINIDGSEDGYISDITLRDRPDLVPPGVCITYTQDNQYDGKSYREIFPDKYPASANCRRPRALNVTIPLRGVNVIQQVSSVNVAAIPDHPKKYQSDEDVPGGGINGLFGSNSPGGRAWWKRHHPKYQKFINVDDLLIYVDGSDGVVFAEEQPEDHPPEPLFKGERVLADLPLTTDYPRELVFGTLEDWMKVSARSLKIEAKIYYGGTEEEYQALPKEDQAIFGFQEDESLELQFQTGKIDVKDKRYSKEFVVAVCTDAVSKNYDRSSRGLPAEDIPQGLAQHYYNQLKEVHWEGNIVLTKKEVENQNLLGKVVNVTGTNHPKWSTMKAQVQQVSYDLESGQTQLTLGTPRHLSIQDTLRQLGLEKSNPLTPEISVAEVEFDPENGSAKSDKITTAYITPKITTETVNPAGGGTVEGCTRLKPILIEEDDKYMLEVTEGLLAGRPVSFAKSEVTRPTKIWAVYTVDALVRKAVSAVNREDIFYYTGQVTVGFPSPTNERGVKIILAEDDPTDISTDPLIMVENKRTVFAMLIGELTEESTDGVTNLELTEYQCGNRAFKFCPPDKGFFIPI